MTRAVVGASRSDRPARPSDVTATEEVGSRAVDWRTPDTSLANRARRLLVAQESSLTLLLLLVVCAAFSLLLVTSYFPITEGWFQDFSNYMSKGLVMYRDFYMFIPPGTPILMHAISAL